VGQAGPGLAALVSPVVSNHIPRLIHLK